MTWILDIVVLIIAISSIIKCYKHGLFKSVMNFLSIFISFFAAQKVAEFLTPTVGKYIYPFFANIFNISSENESSVESLNKFISQFKFIDNNSGKIEKLLNSTQDKIYEAAEGLLTQLSENVAWVLVFIIAFILISIILKIIIAAVDIVLKLPIIKSLNKLFGMAFGVVLAVLSIYIFAFLVTVALPLVAAFQKPFITRDDIDDTRIFSFFYNNNPLEAFTFDLPEEISFIKTDSP